MSLKALVNKVAALTMSGGGPLRGNRWHVDSTNGSDSDSGKSWGSAKATIAAAVAVASAYDEILIRGSFTEAVTINVAGLRIIGAGTGPKEAQWGAAADAVCATITAAYVELKNIYFKPPARTSGTPAAISLGNGAHWAMIRKCRFQGVATAYYAIKSACSASLSADNVHIEDCEFFYMNTATYGTAIFGTEADGQAFSGWVIRRCVFHSCVNAININARCCVITDCEIAEYGNNSSSALAAVLALGIDLSGTASGGGNVVTRNQLGGTYDATLYKVATGGGDQWAGNFNVLTGGVTAANPA